MKPTPGVWGIDLGQCALKALRLQEIDGQLQATAFDYVEYPKILSQPDADPDELTREALTKFLSQNNLRGDIVAIAVPGQSGLARFVKLPPVEEKKIADIVKFEAKQQIPFNLDEVVWDFQKLGASNVVDGFALETEIGLFAMKRDMINKYLQHFKEVGVEVHVIQMAPLALCNFVAYDLLNKEADTPIEGKQPCVVALDLGTDSSNLVVTDGGKIIWQRPIPLGGNHFTRALTKDMKLTFAKAEHLKRNATKSGATELKKILGSLKPVLNDFVGEVQRSLGYFTNTHRDAQVEYMIGLGNAFRLPGMQKFLAEKLQLDVRKLEKMTRISSDVVTSSPIFNENILSFGVAYGLCVQGLKHARLITNLLPSEIRLERLIRSKKPYAVAGAALLLLGLGGVALGNFLDQRPYTAPAVEQAIKKATDTAGRASAMQRAFETAKSDAQKEEEAVKSIVAGQAERLNWMHLLQFLGGVIPQPDGSNLPPEVKKVYWEERPRRKGGIVMSGKEAYAAYQQRVREGFKPLNPMDDSKDPDTLPPGIDDLVQFSIESVDCRFCDDLPTFWKSATRNREQADVRPLDHYNKKLPEGKGWVVEISGYTYHQDKVAFVRNTLLTNIARLGILEEKPADGAAPGAPAGGAPAPAPTPAAGAAPSGKIDFEATKKPVINRISHVLLFNSISKPTAESSGFEIIQTGVLDGLMGGGGGGGEGGARGGGMGMTPAGPPPGAGMMGGAPPGGGPGAPGGAAAGSTRGSWAPLSSRGGAGGGAGGPGGGGGGGRPGGLGMSATVSASVGGSRPAAGGPGPSPSVSTVPGRGSNHARTEFIILFVWNEPTPSDALRGEGDGPK
ncbi:MAG: type IV pilus assembly protein PilM [Gemmataceae bacterium]